MLRSFAVSSPDIHIWSDASGCWGCGAFWQSLWFQLAWEDHPITGASIAVKEFLPIIVAWISWGYMWQGCMVCCHCDNASVVSVINGKYARDPVLAHMLRALFSVCASFDFDITAVHTPGTLNGGAVDALSRNKLHLFFAQVRRASLSTSSVNAPAALGLSLNHPNWNSRVWTAWFNFTLNNH